MSMMGFDDSGFVPEPKASELKKIIGSIIEQTILLATSKESANVGVERIALESEADIKQLFLSIVQGATYRDGSGRAEVSEIVKEINKL